MTFDVASNFPSLKLVILLLDECQLNVNSVRLSVRMIARGRPTEGADEVEDVRKSSVFHPGFFMKD